jgi:hypothetical protein
MRTLFSVLGCGLVLVVLSGCGDEITYMEGDIDGRVIGTIHGVVTDANTNARLEDVEVRWAEGGKIRTTDTDELGYYIISSLESGSYEISFSDTGAYAIARVQDVRIPTVEELWSIAEPTEEDIHHTVIQDIGLYRLEAVLIGEVHVQPDQENSPSAVGVTVIADFTDYDLSPDWYTVTTDSSGAFQFEGLPATQYVSMLMTMPFCDESYCYATYARSDVPLGPTGPADAGIITLSIAEDPPVVIQNNFGGGDFPVTEAPQLTFSKLMNPESFDISFTGPSGNVQFTAEWTNNIILEITPLVPLQANSVYTLTLSGMSNDNNSYSQVFPIETQLGIEYVSTNIERVDGVFDGFLLDSNIEITFTMEINLENYDGYVRLYDSDGMLVNSSVGLSNNGMTLVINPNASLEPAQTYQLDFKVFSSIEGDYAEDEDIRDPLEFTTVVDVTEPDQVTGFGLAMGGGWHADFNTTSFVVKWNPVADADGYRVYGWDNAHNTDQVVVGTFDATDYVMEERVTVVLPAQFDYYQDDQIQTPFTADTRVTLKVAAFNTAGEGQQSAGVWISDGTKPTGTLHGQTGTADNSSGSESKTIHVNFSASEYLDSATPAWSFVETGGDPDYKLPADAASYYWDIDLMGGRLTIVIPAGQNGAGDRLVLSGFKDNSNNVAAESAEITLY